MTHKSLLKLMRGQRNGTLPKRGLRPTGFAAFIVSMLALVTLLTSVIALAHRRSNKPMRQSQSSCPKISSTNLASATIEVMKKVTTIGYAKILNQGLTDTVAASGIATELSTKDIGGMLSKERPPLSATTFSPIQI